MDENIQLLSSAKGDGALTGWLSWLALRPEHQKAVGLISSWGSWGRQLIDVSRSLPFSLKSI